MKISILVLVLVACVRGDRKTEETNQFMSQAKDCTEFISLCGEGCTGGGLVNCDGSPGAWSKDTFCDCYSRAQTTNTIDNAATREIKGAARNCSQFNEFCKNGCEGGYSTSCLRSNGDWYYAMCQCGTTWEGLRAPKVEQTDAVFLDQAYSLHDALRANHSAPALHIDPKAEAFAKYWCQTIARQNNMHHSPKWERNGLGENLYYSSGGITEGADAVQAWYDEIDQYKFDKPGFSHGTGHFTQVVWKSSTGVGCSRAKSYTGGTYVCCNYSPGGNVAGQFENNVLKKLPSY